MNPSITPGRVTEGQKNQFANVLADAVRKAAGTIVDDLSRRGLLNSRTFQTVLGGGDQIVAAVLETVRTKTEMLAEKIKCLRLISRAEQITIGATDGTKIFMKSKIIIRHVDPYFKKYGREVPSRPTGAMFVQVYNSVEDCTFRQIFSNFQVDIERLCLTQCQIVSFLENHEKWIREKDFATYFIFKEKVEGEDTFFFADARASHDGISVQLRVLWYDYVWEANLGHRFVFPTLTA